MGQVQNARPQADQRQVENQQQDVAEEKAGDHRPHEIGALLEQERARRQAVDDEGAHQHGDGRRAWNAQRQQRNHGRVGIGVVGRFRRGHALDGALAEFLRCLGDALLEHIGDEGRDDGADAWNQPQEEADAGAAADGAP